jgi:hypothetical protein
MPETQTIDPIMDPASNPLPTVDTTNTTGTTTPTTTTGSTDGGLLTEGRRWRPGGRVRPDRLTVDTEPTVKKAKVPDTTYTPSTTNVSPLASDQLNYITSQDSPLMQQAATKGQQYATSRGLLNSSLGAQASQQAVIAAAAPIATADASFAQSKVLQNDRLAIDIMRSDMTSGQKNTALDFLLSGESRKKIGKDPGTNFKSYEEVQQQYGGEYAKFIMDTKARKQFQVGEKSPKGSIRVGMPSRSGRVNYRTYESYPDILAGMGVSGSSSRDRATAQKIHDIYGSWDNAMKAAKMWGGNRLSDNEAKQLILSTLK